MMSMLLFHDTESNILHESTSSKSSTTNIFSPTISTILYLPNTSVNKHEHKESASYETNISKMTTQTTFQQKPSSVPPQSSPGQNNSQVVITASIRSSAKVISKPKGLHTTPSMNNNVLHTSIYTTSLDEINVAESTTQKSEMVSNGHHGNSKIGMHIQTYQNIHNILNDSSDNNTVSHNNLQKVAA